MPKGMLVKWKNRCCENVVGCELLYKKYFHALFVDRLKVIFNEELILLLDSK